MIGGKLEQGCVCCHESGLGEGRVVGGRGGCFPWWEVGDGAGGEDGLYLALPDGEDGVAEGLEVRRRFRFGVTRRTCV